MTLLEEYGVATDEEFLKRLRMALYKAANGVYSEAENTAGHAARAELAHDILTFGIDKWVTPFAYAVASIGTITNASTDADIEWTVSSVWNGLAGA